MSLAKKGSRKIIVDENELLWKFIPDKYNSQGVIPVQSISGKGSKLLIILPNWKDPWFDPYGEPNDPKKVTPGFVEKGIKEALKLGWNPEDKGKDLRLEFNSSKQAFIKIRRKE